MVPTQDIERKLRRLVNEKVPAGGTAADTRFSDEDIDDILSDTSSIYAAAAEGWRLKAILSEGPGETKEYSIGQETYKNTTSTEFASYCLQMATMYDEMAAKTDNMSEARILTVRRPDVI